MLYKFKKRGGSGKNGFYITRFCSIRAKIKGAATQICDAVAIAKNILQRSEL